MLVINTVIRDAITANMRKDELRKLVYSQDVQSLLQDGLEKVEQGLTTVEELLKLIDLESADNGETVKMGLQESLELAEDDEEIPQEKIILNESKPKPIEMKPSKITKPEPKIDTDDELLNALKELNIGAPAKREVEVEEDDEDLIDRTSELDDILAGIDFSDSDGLSEEELMAIIKDS